MKEYKTGLHVISACTEYLMQRRRIIEVRANPTKNRLRLYLVIVNGLVHQLFLWLRNPIQVQFWIAARHGMVKSRKTRLGFVT